MCCKAMQEIGTWGIKPGLPVYLLDGLRLSEVGAEEVLEVICGERLELEVLQVGFQEGLKGFWASHESLYINHTEFKCMSAVEEAVSCMHARQSAQRSQPCKLHAE